MSINRHEALSQMKLTTLANLCTDELKQRGCPETSIFALLRKEVAARDAYVVQGNEI